MTQVVTTQPGTTVAGQQTQVLRDWNSGLFACFDDMESCKLTVSYLFILLLSFDQGKGKL